MSTDHIYGSFQIRFICRIAANWDEYGIADTPNHMTQYSIFAVQKVRIYFSRNMYNTIEICIAKCGMNLNRMKYLLKNIKYIFKIRIYLIVKKEYTDLHPVLVKLGISIVLFEFVRNQQPDFFFL